MKFYEFLCPFIKTRHSKTALDKPLYKLSSGRSMVEMLGVLAIIGVLSVGAIAGYSKAMFKYKLNKTTYAYSTLINYLVNAKATYTNIPEYTYLDSYLKKTNSVPEGLFFKNDYWLYDNFGFKSRIFTRNNYIVIDMFLANEGQTYGTHIDICRNLFSDLLIPMSNSLYQVSMYLPNSTSPSSKYGINYCKPSSGNCLHTMGLDDIYSYCQSCAQRSSTDNSCLLVLTI